MIETERHEEQMHYIMSFIGGFFGVYTILNFCDFFGCAQTSNLIYLVTSLLGHNWKQFVLRLGGMFLYMTAIALTVYLQKRSSINLKRVSLIINALAALLLGFLPHDIDPVLGLYPLFFAMAFQWNSFKGAYGFVSSTIFSTNNLRQFTIAITEIFLNKDHSHILKAKFYGKTLLSFHAGVGISYLLWIFFHMHTAWFCLIPIGFGLLMETREHTNFSFIGSLFHAPSN